MAAAVVPASAPREVRGYPPERETCRRGHDVDTFARRRGRFRRGLGILERLAEPRFRRLADDADRVALRLDAAEERRRRRRHPRVVAQRLAVRDVRIVDAASHDERRAPDPFIGPPDVVGVEEVDHVRVVGHDVARLDAQIQPRKPRRRRDRAGQAREHDEAAPQFRRDGPPRERDDRADGGVDEVRRRRGRAPLLVREARRGVGDGDAGAAEVKTPGLAPLVHHDHGGEERDVQRVVPEERPERAAAELAHRRHVRRLRGTHAV